MELDAGPDGSDGELSDASSPDASELPDASFDTDASVELDSGVDSALDSAIETGDAAPIMLAGSGPVMTADDFAGYAGSGSNDGFLDAVFTATISAPIVKLVIVNTDADGSPDNSVGYYTYWATQDIPSSVPELTAPAGFTIHTRLAGTTDPFFIPILGSDDTVELDMYVSFFPGSARPPYYRLYVFSEDDELTQIVDFEDQSP